MTGTGHISRNFDRKEDDLLLEAVSKYGLDAWNQVAAVLGTRTPRQCRNRYTLFLGPNVNNTPWTTEEDDLLRQKYDELGPRWAVLRSFFPGRTDLNVKNRFGFLARNRADVRALKQKFQSEQKGEVSDEDGRAQAKKRKETRRVGEGSGIVTLDDLFNSLPYYMKRCVLLEAVLRQSQLAVPPEGICDFKQWIQSAMPLGQDDVVVVGDGDLPTIPEADGPEKQ
jgi:hypothetical protein